MKKLILIVMMALSLPMMAGVHSYVNQSVLAGGSWVKISVTQSGVCKMSFGELRDAGISNPSQVRVFGYGGAQLTQDFTKRKIDDLPQVPVYVGDSYVLFYVQGPISWEWTGSRFAHTRNTYSEAGYYFLTDNAGTTLAPTTAEAVSGSGTDVTSYINLQVHEKDSLNLVDRSGVAGGGKEFFGEQFSTNQKRSFSFTTLNAETTAKSNVYIRLAAKAAAVSTFTANVNGSIGSATIAQVPTDNYTFGVVGQTNFSAITKQDKQQVQLQFINSTTSALGWLDYIELATPCALQMTGDWMTVRTNTNAGSATPLKYHLTQAGSAVQIWDVTDLAAIKRMPTTQSGNEIQWTGSNQDGVHTYVAVKTGGTSYVKAKVVGEISNQNLHKLKNIDYVIICPEGYEAEARRLAQAHEQKQSITWAVVTDQQVYNEFSSGTPDASAYRWLMKMLYDRANNGDGQKPRWLLLIGHGSFDNRGLLPNSGSNLLLTYQADESMNEVRSYASDDYFGWLDDNEGTDSGAYTAKLDIGVGRLPVGSVEEAAVTVDKLIAYMDNTQHGKWKNQLLYLADDGDKGQHTQTAEESAEITRKNNLDFVVHKVYLDAYPQEVNASGESYPLAKNRVQNLLKSGVLFFDYSGHGGYNGVTSELVLSMHDIEKMNNVKQGFWAFLTCNFGQFDSGNRCAAEVAMLNPNGGAMGVLAATRTVYAADNTNLNRAFAKELFKHSNVFHYEATLGEALKDAKNTLGVSDKGNKLAYVLIGDPAIRLNYPTDYQVETTTQMDTLHALAIQQVEGQIVDEDHAVVNDFNGDIEITIYDKMQVITTRDNDDQTEDAVKVDYNDYPNTIFTGSAKVKEGKFQYTFMVPKDIRYNYGKGRIVYYAHDDTYNEDAVGHFEDFIVGGTGSVVAVDTVGPEMNIYLNSPAFADGGTTYPTPRFFAELYDPNGINTAGAGIGHDLLLIVDDDPKQTYAINEYFTSENGSYQKGLVSYLMDAMTDGPHSLSFRAWDLMNNSTTKSLNFVVESGIDPSIYSVMSYPNPVQQSGVMNITVLYDQPDELLTTEVYVYNLNGQIIWSKIQNNPENIQLNLGELNMMPGVYLYSVKIKSATSKYSTCSGKIIVTK